MNKENGLIDNLKSGNGKLELSGTRYLLIRPDTIIGIQKAMERELGSERCGQLMAEGGRIGGSRSSGKYREQGRSGEELIQYMCEVGTDLGWGVFKVLHFGAQDNSFILEVADSAFARAYGESDHPVCHLIRGVLEGLGCSVFQKKATCVEIECLAKGDCACRFEVSTPGEGASG